VTGHIYIQNQYSGAHFLTRGPRPSMPNRLCSVSGTAMAAALFASAIVTPDSLSAQTTACSASPCTVSGTVQGQNGAAAANGEDGQTGGSGMSGEAGGDGEAGADGERGGDGTPGGIDGSAGASGVNGSMGRNGASGANGLAGRHGAAGSDAGAGQAGVNAANADVVVTAGASVRGGNGGSAGDGGSGGKWRRWREWRPRWERR